MNLRHDQRGISIVEIMVAIAIGLVLMLGIMQIFISSKQSYRINDALGRLQENARFALDTLTRDIRMAGYLGCNSEALVHNQMAAKLPDIEGGVTVYEHTGLPAVLVKDASNNLTESDAVANTDAIFIRGAGTDDLALQNGMTAEDSAITLPANTIFEQGDVAIVSDCNDADIFQIGVITTDKNQGIASIQHAALSKAYGKDARVRPLAYTAYYIGADNGNGNRLNLYRKRVNGTSIITEPLIEGIENMQIKFGYDVNGDGALVRYVDADPGVATPTTRIGTIRISLLVAALEPNTALGPQTLRFNDGTITFNDRRLRHTFTTTIQLRNSRHPT